MVPTFLQNRRSVNRSQRIVNLVAILLLLAVYSLAFSYLLASRALSQSGKFTWIILLLLTVLCSMGILKRLVG
jgi:hypothetical protein